MLTSRSNGGDGGHVLAVEQDPARRSAARSPAIIRSVVVLPEPDGPSIEKNSPSRDVEVDAGHRHDVAEALLDALESHGDGRRRIAARARRAFGRDRQAGPRGWGQGRVGPSRLRVRRTVPRTAVACQAGPDACPASVRRRLRRRDPATLASVGAVARHRAGRRRRRVGCDGRAAIRPRRPSCPGAPRRRARSTSSPRTTRSSPTPLDLVPGETVLLHVINGGLEVHEAVIGDAAVQDAWEVAEAATVGRPPGPTPVVSVPPDVAGLRVVVALRRARRRRLDGARRRRRRADRRGSSAATSRGTGRRGMQIPVRWVADDARPVRAPDGTLWSASPVLRRPVSLEEDPE